MMMTLYYTSVDVTNNKWSARLREKFSTVSNLECGGHAALANNAIDYWIWINGTCYLGDLAHDSDVHIEDDSASIITIHRGMMPKKMMIKQFHSLHMHHIFRKFMD